MWPWKKPVTCECSAYKRTFTQEHDTDSFVKIEFRRHKSDFPLPAPVRMMFAFTVGQDAAEMFNIIVRVIGRFEYWFEIWGLQNEHHRVYWLVARTFVGFNWKFQNFWFTLVSLKTVNDKTNSVHRGHNGEERNKKLKLKFFWFVYYITIKFHHTAFFIV